MTKAITERLPVAEGIDLTRVGKSSGAQFYALFDRNRAFFATGLGGVTDMKPEDAQRYCDQAQEHADAGNGLDYFIDYFQATVGYLSLRRIGESDIATMMACAERRLQGTGVATQSVQAMLDHGMTALGLSKVQYHIDPDNYRSNAMAFRTGAKIVDPKPGTWRSHNLWEYVPHG